MRRLGLISLAIFSLWGCAASAQVFPNIPANTVLGRLGSGNPGPPQPIPLINLSASLPFPPGTSGYALIGNGTSIPSTFQGFLQAGTGAVPQTWQNAIRPYVNVKQFGAVGDGVTDDTAAINAAYTYAATIGSCVYMPDPVYLVSAVTFPGGSPPTTPCIVGNGLGTKLKQDGAHLANDILTIGSGTLNDTSNTYVANISFTAASAKIGGAAIKAKGAARPLFKNVAMADGTMYNGIVLDGVDYVEFSHVYIQQAVNDGIIIFDGWDCGFTPVTKTTNGTTSTSSAVIHLSSTSGISVGMNIYDTTLGPNINISGTVQSIVANTSVTLTHNVEVAVGSGDSIVFGGTCNGTGASFDDQTLISSVGGTGVVIGGGVGEVKFNSITIQSAVGNGVTVRADGAFAPAGVENREIYFGPASLIDANGANNLLVAANSLSVLSIDSSWFNASIGASIDIEAQHSQLNPVETGAIISVSNATIGDSGGGGLIWKDQGVLSLSGIGASYNTGPGVTLNPSAGIGKVSITGGKIQSNTTYGISATTLPATLSVDGVNLGNNTTAGTNGITPSTTVSCSGNVGGSDVCSANNRYDLTVTHSFTATGLVTLSDLATQATNTVLGNATSGTASPTALAVGSCSTATSALIWTTNTGFGCNTSITATSMPTTGLTGTLQAAQEPAHTGGVTNTAGSLALTVITNANLTGVITSSGNATSIASQTGTGTKFVVDTSPTLVTPVLGVATGTSLALGSSALPSGAKLIVSNNASNLPTVTTGTVFVTSAADGTSNAAEFDSFGTGNFTAYISFIMRRANGTAASPSALKSGDLIAAFTSVGYGATGYVSAAQPGFWWQTTQDWTDSAAGSQLKAFTVPNGSTTQTLAATFGQDQSLTLATQIFMPSITTSSSAQTGTVCWTTGTGKFTVDTTAGCLTSLAKAKNIDEDIDPSDAVRMVKNLRAVSFHYKKGWGDSGRYEQFGLIADQAATIDERLVGRDPEGALQGVRYQEYGAVLTAAMKKIIADNDNLHAEVIELKRKIAR